MEPKTKIKISDMDGDTPIRVTAFCKGGGTRASMIKASVLANAGWGAVKLSKDRLELVGNRESTLERLERLAARAHCPESFA